MAGYNARSACKGHGKHITDELGQAQLRSVFVPHGWVVNKVEHDYGIEFEIEIFEQHKSTGASFKVQLKSSEQGAHSASEDFLSQEIDIQNAEYLCHEVRTPVALIHADVKARRTFWHMPQLDAVALEKLSGGNSASITFRIPTANELPATLEGLLEAVVQASNILAIRILKA